MRDRDGRRTGGRLGPEREAGQPPALGIEAGQCSEKAGLAGDGAAARPLGLAQRGEILLGGDEA